MKINKNLSLYANYGKTYQIELNLFPAFSQNRNNLETKGYTFSQIIDKYYKLTLADNFDIGAKYITEKFSFYPTIFYSFIKNKQAVVNLPGVGPFPANVADARSYGIEFLTVYVLNNKVQMFGSYSYNRYYYAGLLNIMGNIYNVNKKQVVGAPEDLFKMGLTYTPIRYLFITPTILYTGVRYGDVLHTQKIPSYAIANLNITYKKYVNDRYIKDFGLSFDVENLFNKKYISLIDAIDYRNSNEPSYYVGIPFNASISIFADF